jgi:hypothetical protein
MVMYVKPFAVVELRNEARSGVLDEGAQRLYGNAYKAAPTTAAASTAACGGERNDR